jgi:CheY-like chemotaxis protein
VEDDQAVRDATRMLLKVNGYRVTAVSSLAEALEKTSNGAGLDLLVTDYHLSAGETGIEIITVLRERLRVPLKSVLITGDTSSAIKRLPLDPCLRITSKPTKADELLTLLRALLATRPCARTPMTSSTRLQARFTSRPISEISRSSFSLPP